MHSQVSPGQEISEFWDKMSETNMLQWFGIDHTPDNK